MSIDKLAVLHTLRDVINQALCEEQGHVWKPTRMSRRSGLQGTGPWEQCETCGETRPMPENSTMGDTTITIQGASTAGDTIHIQGGNE